MPGFAKDHQAFVFVRFADSTGARAWLGEIQADLTSANVVQQFRARFKSLRGAAPHPDDRDAGALRYISATWVNLALSFAGLRQLVGPAQAARFPATFRLSQVPGAVRPATEVHAVLIVGADHTEDLDAELERQSRRMSTSGVQQVMTLRGDTLPGDQRGHEHFGFKDAISQPRIAGTDWGKGPPIEPGEFVLGYPDQSGQRSGAGLPEWSQNGSFLAFLQLQQHVDAFWKSMKWQAQQFGVQPEALAEWIVGRKHDATGDQLADPPSRVCHIGRGYARWLPPSDAQRHRILRRGIPYGPPWNPQAPNDTTERGLLFVAYQADLERQFEHVWTKWLNSSDFPMPATGRDGLIGQVSWLNQIAPHGQRRAITSAPGRNGATINLSLPAFVTPRHAAYFFAPGIHQVSVLRANSVASHRAQ